MLGSRVGSAWAFLGSMVGSDADDEGLGRRIVAILGQSNATGRADTDDITDATVQTELETSFAAVQLKQQKATTAADPIVWVSYSNGPLAARTDSPTENFGTELSMGRYLDNALPDRWAIVKMGVGSSGLADHWDDDSLYPAASPPNLFTQSVAWLRAAESELGGTISAIVWIQGETDALDATDASNYEANLNEIFAAYRAVWPNLPIVINKLHNSIDAVFTEKATIRAAQVAVAAADPLVSIVDLDDLPLKVDNTHFSADMNVTAGDRLGLAVLGLLGINVHPDAAFSSVPTGLSVAFTDESTDDDGTIASWYWTFGDGDTSTSQNPTHVYASNGTYSVTLTVTDNDGGTDSISHDVTATVPTWFVDGTSGIAAPEDDTEWASFISDNALTNWSAPDDGFLLQDASGNPVGYNGIITLTANASPSYQNAVTGWDLVAVGTADATANQRFRSLQAALPNVATESFLMLVFVAVLNNPGAARGLCGIGAGGIEHRVATSGGSSGLARATAGSTVTSATELGTGVRPVFLMVDRTASEARLHNDQEKLSPTFGSPTGELVDLGATIGASPPTARFLRAYLWFGAAAERTDQDKRDLLEAMGWTVTGYGV